MPKRTDITGHATPGGRLCATWSLRVFAAGLIVLSVASGPSPVRAASALSDGGVSPTTGTTATTFTFSVHYTSTDSPARPAQAVWAQVGTATVTLTKVDGSAHDGTWQGTSTLPAGSWTVSFHGATSGDTQPEPLPGPIVTVAEPPPTPQPLPPAPQPTPDVETTRPQTPSPAPRVSRSDRPTETVATPTRTAEDADPPDSPATPPGSMLGSLLIIGGSMSIVGAALLARQWQISRKARR